MSEELERLTGPQIDEWVSHFVSLADSDVPVRIGLLALQHLKAERQESAKWKRQCLLPLLTSLAEDSRMIIYRDGVTIAGQMVNRDVFDEMIESGWLELMDSPGYVYKITPAGREAYRAMSAKEDGA